MNLSIKLPGLFTVSGVPAFFTMPNPNLDVFLSRSNRIFKISVSVILIVVPV
jgi:hypothetical protein